MTRPSTCRRGFTLIELLLAMFILAIGLIAIASIFPVAGYLQKEATDEVLTLQVKRNAEAIVAARGVPAGLPAGSPVVVPPPSGSLNTDYPLKDRCYPTYDFANDPTAEKRPFYWVPLFRNAGTATSPQWVTYVFILARRPDATYAGGDVNSGDPAGVPKVYFLTAAGSNGNNQLTGINHGGNIQPGDQILGSNGQILLVSEVVNNNTLKIAGKIQGQINFVWYAKPNATGETSPVRRIIAVGGEGV